MGRQRSDDERYYRLDGVIFRVRVDRLEHGAEYLRNGRWVWTPITSAHVMQDPRARELAADEVEPSDQIP